MKENDLTDYVWSNATKYTASETSEANSFSQKDNFIIKGDNLPVLSVLKYQFANKVKMIYIDPPYNSASAALKYEDKRSKDAWLSFMKERLLAAWELLSEDGVLLIQISFHEYPYLRVLADELFTSKNHVFDMNLLVRHPERLLTADKPFNDVIEFTLIYSKNSTYRMPRKKVPKTVDKYQYEIKTTGLPADVQKLGNKTVEIYLPDQVQIIRNNEGQANLLHRETIRGSIREKNSSGRFYVAHLEKLRKKFPPLTFIKVPNIGDDGIGHRWFELPKQHLKNGAYYQGMPQSSSYTEKPYPNFMDFKNHYNTVNHEGGVNFRNGKKPEALLKFYVELFTNEGDIVLDFFMGSGTTQAVAMKLKRQFLGVEQMDYITTHTIPRLINVINADPTGISKDINWQGGGSFVFAELMEAKANEMDQTFNTSYFKSENHL